MAENLPTAVQRAYAAVGKIRFEGMHYRRDIGAKELGRSPRGAKGARSSKANPSRPARPARPKSGNFSRPKL